MYISILIETNRKNFLKDNHSSLPSFDFTSSFFPLSRKHLKDTDQYLKSSIPLKLFQTIFPQIVINPNQTLFTSPFSFFKHFKNSISLITFLPFM